MTALSLCLALGLFAALAFRERFGVSPGGLIAPGFVAYYLDDPFVIATLAAAAVSSWIVGRAIALALLLDGPRRLALFLALGMAVIAGVQLVTSDFDGDWPADQALALVVPGLIARHLDRDDPVILGSGLIVVAVLVRLAMLAALIAFSAEVGT